MARKKKTYGEQLADGLIDPTGSRRTNVSGGHIGENGNPEHIRHLTRWAQRSVLGHTRRIDR